MGRCERGARVDHVARDAVCHLDADCARAARTRTARGATWDCQPALSCAHVPTTQPCHKPIPQPGFPPRLPLRLPSRLSHHSSGRDPACARSAWSFQPTPPPRRTRDTNSLRRMSYFGRSSTMARFESVFLVDEQFRLTAEALPSSRHSVNRPRTAHRARASSQSTPDLPVAVIEESCSRTRPGLAASSSDARRLRPAI